MYTLVHHSTLRMDSQKTTLCSSMASPEWLRTLRDITLCCLPVRQIRENNILYIYVYNYIYIYIYIDI